MWEVKEFDINAKKQTNVLDWLWCKQWRTFAEAFEVMKETRKISPQNEYEIVFVWD